jgi:hypothetical protein
MLQLPHGGLMVGVLDDVQGQAWRAELQSLYLDRIQATARQRAALAPPVLRLAADPWQDVARALREGLR